MSSALRLSERIADGLARAAAWGSPGSTPSTPTLRRFSVRCDGVQSCGWGCI